MWTVAAVVGYLSLLVLMGIGECHRTNGGPLSARPVRGESVAMNRQLLRVHVQGLLPQAPHGALQDRRRVPDRLPQQDHREAPDGSGKKQQNYE